jgi:hypothetical protein
MKKFATMSVQVQNSKQKRLRQQDVISPKLFTNAMEDMFKTLNWKGRGININDEYISRYNGRNAAGPATDAE